MSSAAITFLTSVAFLASLGASAGEARAAAAGQAATVEARPATRLQAESVQLRLELERMNAEIAQLKRVDRGVGDDYRLRRRMAEAEALARRLTAAESALRRLSAPVAPSSTPLPPSPVAEPGDGPNELDAKADVLADQARRLAREADTFQRAAAQVRTRQTLRRRAGLLERDPFAGLEGSKRNILITPSTRGANMSAGGEPTRGPQSPVSPPAAESDKAAGGAAPPPAATEAPGPGTPGVASAPPAPPPSGKGALPSGTGEAPQTSPTPQDSSGPNPGSSGTPTGAPTPSPNPTATPQLRALLDPETVAEIKRLEGAGGPAAQLEAYERAAAALRAKAEALDAQSKQLRAKAQR